VDELADKAIGVLHEKDEEKKVSSRCP